MLNLLFFSKTALQHPVQRYTVCFQRKPSDGLVQYEALLQLCNTAPHQAKSMGVIWNCTVTQTGNNLYIHKCKTYQQIKPHLCPKSRSVLLWKWKCESQFWTWTPTVCYSALSTTIIKTLKEQTCLGTKVAYTLVRWSWSATFAACPYGNYCVCVSTLRQTCTVEVSALLFTTNLQYWHWVGHLLCFLWFTRRMVGHLSTA